MIIELFRWINDLFMFYFTDSENFVSTIGLEVWLKFPRKINVFVWILFLVGTNLVIFHLKRSRINTRYLNLDFFLPKFPPFQRTRDFRNLNVNLNLKSKFVADISKIRKKHIPYIMSTLKYPKHKQQFN